MRRATVALAGLLTLTLAVPASGQDGWASRVGDAVRQDVWCITLHVMPYLVEVPPDIDCEYEPRTMTVAEAGSYYSHHVARSNYVGSLWGCAWDKARNGLTWKQDHRRSKRWGQAHHRWADSLRAVRWPDVVRRQVARLLDAGAAYEYRSRVAYNHRSYQASVLSGDWAAMERVGSRSAEAAEQVRASLGLRHVRTGGKDCKRARKYERQHRP